MESPVQSAPTSQPTNTTPTASQPSQSSGRTFAPITVTNEPSGGASNGGGGGGINFGDLLNGVL